MGMEETTKMINTAIYLGVFIYFCALGTLAYYCAKADIDYMYEELKTKRK